MSLDTAKATAILRDLTVKFDNSVQAAKPFYPNVCTDVTSTGRSEKYGLLGNMPGVREWLGDRKFEEVRAANFELENQHWESSLGIEKRDMRDDTMGLYGPLMEQLGIEAAYHPDELVADLVNDGHSTACFDGQYFFDTDHVWGDSGTQDNDLTGAAAAATTPTAAEFKASFNTAWAAMIGFKNDQGKYMNRSVVQAMPNLMAMVPIAMYPAAVEGITAALTGGGNTNVVIDMPQIVASPLLSSSATWFLLNLGAPLKPFVFQRRQPLQRQTKGLDDIETKLVKFMTEAEYATTYLAWWTAVRYQFT